MLASARHTSFLIIFRLTCSRSHNVFHGPNRSVACTDANGMSLKNNCMNVYPYWLFNEHLILAADNSELSKLLEKVDKKDSGKVFVK